MRYKVRASDDELFRRAVALIGDSVPIFLANAERRFLAVGELPAMLREKLGALGLEVAPDLQLSREGAPAAA